MQDSSLFTIEDMSFAYGDNTIFKGFNLDIPKDKITCLLGGNGCGKTTLFNLMTKNLNCDEGSIKYQGRSLDTFKLKEFAQCVSIVHQTNITPRDISVETLVGYGRIPYASNLLFNTRLTETDQLHIDSALEMCDLVDLKDVSISDLSGGQLQRAWIAMALAQDTDVVFLDEPTTYLDIKYQIEVLNIINKLNVEYNKTIIMVLHDINQAIHISDYVVALKGGQVIKTGKPSKIIDEMLIKDVYDVDLTIENINSKKYVLTV